MPSSAGSAFFGALSEHANARANEALQDLSAGGTRVIRDGAEAVVPAN